jgi:hypothetical protein
LPEVPSDAPRKAADNDSLNNVLLGFDHLDNQTRGSINELIAVLDLRMNLILFRIDSVNDILRAMEQDKPIRTLVGGGGGVDNLKYKDM